MSDLREAGELSTGEILGHRYVLRERIGEGGMARVYRADDEALGRTVAIKVLRDVDAIGSVERARSETTLLAGLNHHGLVTLFDAHIDDGEVSYLVMEYVEGVTLRERIRQGPIPPQQVASIAVDLAEALYVAHSAGIVHRDIKPSNVLLWRSPLPGREWRAKLADFGIAHLLDSARVTTPGMIVGTVAYVAPEQARGETPAPPADIYALGLLLMEALTGRRPFADAEGIGAVIARLSAPPEVPESLQPEWRGLLRGMTSMRPEDRPTALEVAITAERLAVGGTPLPLALADEQTQAAPVVPTGETRVLPAVPGGAAGAAETGETRVLPGGSIAAAAAAASGAGTGTAHGTEPPTRRAMTGRTQLTAGDTDRRRRGVLIAVIISAVLVLGAVTAAIWWSAQAGAVPAPQPSVSVVAPSPLPSGEPAPSTPAEETDDDTVGTVDGGTGNSGTGGGNENSGPGNNNGKDKGKDKGKGP